MSITYGDNLKHNNPLFPIVDVEDVKGGIRTIATFSNTDLYNAFNDIPDKLKQNYTSLIVTSTSQHYYLTGTDATITTSWTLTGSGLSGTGTTNSIAKWTGSTSLGDSLITDNGDTVTINGNLNVIGTSSTITSENLLVKDPIILLAGSQSTPLFDSGLFVNRGNSDTQAFIWDESEKEFSFFSTTSSSSTLGNVSIGTYSNVRTGPLSIGTGTASNSRFVVSSSGGTNSLIVGENGSVSIGGALTSYPLKVYGNAQVTNFFYTNITEVSNSIIFDGFGSSGIKRNNIGLEFFNFATSSSAIRFTNNSYGTNTGETTMLVDVDKKYVGIGTASPSTKLHIFATQSGAFRLQDGTQQNDYILKSDSNGVASWVSLSTIGISGASGSVSKFTGTSSLGTSRFFDDGSTGSYGSGTSRVYFLSGGNTWLTLNRSQAAMNFILGNPQISQTCQIQSTNTLGLTIESAGYTQFKVGASYSISLVLTENGSVYNAARGTNTLYGLNALLVSTGINNTAIGTSALQNNLGGLLNTAVGMSSMTSNTSGNYNTAVGAQALTLSVSGNDNTAIGIGSQQLATQSSSNVSVGRSTLYNNLSGGLVAIGTYALTNNTIGTTNTAVGHNSLQENTTTIASLIITDSGSSYTPSTTFSNVQLLYISGSTATTYPILDVYVGSTGSVSTITLVTNGSGFKNTSTIMGANLGTGVTFSVSISSLQSGDANTTIGYQSLLNNTTGSYNTVIGSTSMQFNTTGYANTALGSSALKINTTGFQNTVVGYQSLNNNTTGYANIAIGYQALWLNNTGEVNIAIGYQALWLNTIGQRNIAIGEATMASNKSGYDNISIGNGILNSATASLSNTVIGSSALQNLLVGNYNTVIGRNSAYNSTTSDGLGGVLSLTQSSNSVYIGAEIRPIENKTNQIIIGYGATGSGSNSVTLGASTITKTQLRGTINIGNVPQYASNGAAISGGLVPGDIYQTLSNVLMVVI